MKTFFLTVLLVLFAISCSKEADSPVLNEVISASNLSDISSKIATDNNISREDIDYFSNGVARLSMISADSLIGKTVKEVIEHQKRITHESSVNSLKIATSRAQINLCQKFQILTFEPLDSADQLTNVISFRISNLTDKKIINLQGYLNFINASGQILKKFPINIKKPLDPKQSYELKTPPYLHDVKNENDIALRSQKSTLRSLWTPIYVEFEGGNKIGPVQ
jgi:hypothetical protein